MLRGTSQLDEKKNQIYFGTILYGLSTSSCTTLNIHCSAFSFPLRASLTMRNIFIHNNYKFQWIKYDLCCSSKSVALLIIVNVIDMSVRCCFDLNTTVHRCQKMFSLPKVGSQILSCHTSRTKQGSAPVQRS